VKVCEQTSTATAGFHQTGPAEKYSPEGAMHVFVPSLSYFTASSETELNDLEININQSTMLLTSPHFNTNTY